MSRFKIWHAVLLISGLAVAGCPPNVEIPAGMDCFTTPPGASRASFAAHPIPAGFFGPGSEPFAGTISFRGNPQNVLDTCVERLDALTFRGSKPASTAIALRELDLMGSRPVKVRLGDRETRWDVRASVSTVEPRHGTMRVTRTQDNGGTFEAELPVSIRLTFKPRDAGLEKVVFDTGELRMEPEVIKTTKPWGWVHKTDLPVHFDAEKKYTADNNFVAGVGTDGTLQMLEHRGERWGHVSTLATLPEPGAVASSTDCFTSPAGGSSVTFADDPIPADFFADGSEPFAGEIVLSGNPDHLIDSCVQRLDTIAFKGSRSATTRIALTELDLVSDDPIPIRIDGKVTEWDVAVSISDVDPPTGSMTVNREGESGGTFDSEIPLFAKLTFTSRDPAFPTRILDMGDSEPDVIRSTGASWATAADLPIRYAEDRGFSAENGFVPAVSAQHALVEIQHRSRLAAHLVRIPIEIPIPIPR